jgi:hypothetical protein
MNVKGSTIEVKTNMPRQSVSLFTLRW